MSFKVFYENSEPTSLQTLVFKPYKYDEVEPREREAVAKPKAKCAPKAKSVLKRPGEAILSRKAVGLRKAKGKIEMNIGKGISPEELQSSGVDRRHQRILFESRFPYY